LVCSELTNPASREQLGAMRRAAKLFGQVRKHGLTGILGFGKRLKG
jgi:hypothetical protein